MIQANELRIGNWVKCKVSNDAGTYMVIGLGGWIRYADKKKKDSFIDERLIKIQGGARDNENYPESKIAGIPLTPEILIACGFVNAYSAFHDERYIYNLKIHPEIHFQWDSDYEAIIVSKADNDEGMMFGCKYLHQLQNLYHSLTGNELDIKL